MFAPPERRAWVSGNFAEEFALKLQQEAAMATGADGTALRTLSECLRRSMFLCFVRFFGSCLQIKGTGSTVLKFSVPSIYYYHHSDHYYHYYFIIIIIIVIINCRHVSCSGMRSVCQPGRVFLVFYY